ncbi:hypothetical protein C8R44DRAFT_831121 [Mycena epipterygia]|nr:hypothetical protein C8R44DRAFT_831121 [Mycena epipterygia]
MYLLGYVDRRILAPTVFNASQIAGALWEFPPAVCGQHTDSTSLATSKEWAMTAYHIWDGIATVPELSQAAGVRMMPADFFPTAVENDPAQYSKMIGVMASGVRDPYELLAPIIVTDRAMEWLTELVASNGAEFVTETIEVDLLEGELFAGDKNVYPTRGGLIRVINDGVNFPKVEAALAISADAVHTANEIIFLVPRNDNILLIGGIAESGLRDLNLTLDSPICEAFLPGLEKARLNADYPLAQGLRPGRGQNVRVESKLRKAGSRIVHSYGHGGSGWSLSFGCADDVAMLVEEILAGIPAKSMRGWSPDGGSESQSNGRILAVHEMTTITHATLQAPSALRIAGIHSLTASPTAVGDP